MKCYQRMIAFIYNLSSIHNMSNSNDESPLLFPRSDPYGARRGFRGGLNKDLTSFYTNDFKATSPNPS